MARVLTEGLSALPQGALWAAFAGGIVGVLLTLLGRIKKIAKFVPSPVALGIAFLVAPYYSVAIWFAALLAWLYRKRRPEKAERYTTSLASGLIAGEGIMLVVVAVLLISEVGWV
jgi:uncharacterized oligopeptide transporter (OPT) family protein